SFSLIDLYMDLDGPFRSPTFFSPSLAARAMPAACCWDLDLAGMVELLEFQIGWCRWSLCRDADSTSLAVARDIDRWQIPATRIPLVDPTHRVAMAVCRVGRGTAPPEALRCLECHLLTLLLTRSKRGSSESRPLTIRSPDEY